MSYQVLARKWRPKNFEEVVGQEHVVRALSNALNQNRLHHAYLFSGTRGIGKTSIARILAKAFNCETGITSSPCGKCDACREIDAGSFIDLIEVDAASRTKVEDTRDLLDNVQYLPSKGKYKIYIIDEVHMLSGHSFNALLKTLEEPPEHVKFLLATTDPQKLPITVLSRCLQFNLKALGPEPLKKQLQNILDQEKISYEDEALYHLATSANGSVRDSLSLLDQAISFGENGIKTADVKTMLGTIDTHKAISLLESLVAKDADSSLQIINELNELAVDFSKTLDELLEVLHQINLVQLVPNTELSNWQYPKLIKELATKIPPEEVQLYYQIALIGKRDLNLAPNPKLGFEMVILRMLAFRPDTQNTKAPVADKQRPKVAVRQESAPLKQQKTVVRQPQTASNTLEQLEVTGPTAALLRHCIIDKNENGKVELLLEPNHAPLLNKTHEERISKAFTKLYNTPTTVTITIGTTNMATSANLKKEQEIKKQNEADETIEKDQGLKNLMDKFGAKVISNKAKE